MCVYVLANYSNWNISSYDRLSDMVIQCPLTFTDPLSQPLNTLINPIDTRGSLITIARSSINGMDLVSVKQNIKLNTTQIAKRCATLKTTILLRYVKSTVRVNLLIAFIFSQFVGWLKLSRDFRCLARRRSGILFNLWLIIQCA